jgi:hypothetical protein
LLGGVVTRGKVSKEKSVGWSRGCEVLMIVNEFMEFGNWFIFLFVSLECDCEVEKLKDECLNVFGGWKPRSSSS